MLEKLRELVERIGTPHHASAQLDERRRQEMERRREELALRLSALQAANIAQSADPVRDD
jgi:hypothetical protein